MNPLPQGSPRRVTPPAPGLRELIEEAGRAMEEGRALDAVEAARAASRLAPMRGDVRALLADALSLKAQRRSDSGDSGPRRVRSLPREPLFPEDSTPEPGSIRIEAIPSPAAPADPVRSSRPVFASSAALPRPEGRTAARGVRALPESRGGGRRRPSRLGLASAFLSGSVLAAAAALGGWLYFSGRLDSLVRAPGESAPPSAAPVRPASPQDRALIDQAKVYLSQNRFALAIEKLDLLPSGPEKDARLAEAHAKQGEAAHSGRRHREALKAYEQAFRLAPRNGDYAFQLGWLHYLVAKQTQDKTAQGEALGQAELHLKASLGIEPDSAKALDALAKVEIARHNQVAAAEYLRRVIESKPESPEARSARDKLEAMGMKP